MTNEKHEIVTARMIDGRLIKPFWAGSAIYHSGDVSYFEARISLFQEPWYISANRNAKTFTIFKEKIEENGKTYFRQPIGKAFVADRFKSYLKLCVPLWNPLFPPFLSLYPSK